MTATNSFLQLAAPAGLRRGAGAPERALAAATCKCWPLVRARHSYNDKQGAMHVAGGVLLPSWRRHLDRHVGVPPPPFTLSVVSASLLLQNTASTALIAVCCCCCCCCCCRQARQRRRRRRRTSGLLRPRGPTRGTRAVGMGPRCHYIQGNAYFLANWILLRPGSAPGFWRDASCAASPEGTAALLSSKNFLRS